MAWFQVADYYCSELAGYWTARNFFWLCFPFASHEKTRVILIVARFLNQSQWPAKFTSYFMWTLCLLFFGKYALQSQNLMMSVFCSNTLIFAPECWKCTLRSPAFKIFRGVMPLNRTPLVTCTFSAHKSRLWREFFPSLPTQKLLPPTVLLKSKLTLEARNSRLDSCLSKLERFEFRDARIESQVSMIKDQGSKKPGFLKERCCTVT